jgi:hypothetical protein
LPEPVLGRVRGQQLAVLLHSLLILWSSSSSSSNSQLLDNREVSVHAGGTVTPCTTASRWHCNSSHTQSQQSTANQQQPAIRPRRASPCPRSCQCY